MSLKLPSPNLLLSPLSCACAPGPVRALREHPLHPGAQEWGVRALAALAADPRTRESLAADGLNRREGGGQGVPAGRARRPWRPRSGF